MDVRQLEYVVAVVDHGTLTKAAAALFVSQPSVSHGIARLEAELGIALFERVGRGVALTPAGEAVVGPARQVLRDLRVLEDSVGAVIGLEGGRLDVVALPTLAADPLADIVGAFRRAHPRVVVAVHEAETAAGVAAQVRDGRAEVGLTELPVPGDGLDAETLATQPLVLILPPGDGRVAVTVEMLADLPLVVTQSGTSVRSLLEVALLAIGRDPLVAVETESREALVPLVLAGAGAAVVPLGMSEVAARQGATVASIRPPLDRAIGVVTREGARSPGARAFLALAREGLRGAAEPTG
jgi:LysR family carnitine catabolism transcriptional activator